MSSLQNEWRGGALPVSLVTSVHRVRPPIRHALRWATLFALVTIVLPLHLAAEERDPVAKAQEFLNAGQAQAAVDLLDSYLERNPSDAGALLLRSTARFMLGDREGGGADLDRSLELAPTVRQAWLNRAALDLSEKRYQEAYEALLKAQELDPAATDNPLNLGAVLLLMGRLREASAQFEEHLRDSQDSADAFYLVASNYALAGYAALSLEHLKKAIELDERSRLRARADANFTELSLDPRFQQILNTDGYRHPPGSYVETRAFQTPYDAENGNLLGAVLDALHGAGMPFDARVEVTPDWALVWGEVRIKVSRGPQGGGVVEVSAPAHRFTPRQWQETIEKLFRQPSLLVVR